MFNIKKIILTVGIIFLAALLFMTGCNDMGGENKRGTGKNKQMTVRIGYFPNITHAQALLGMADGTFQKALGDNVKIESKIFNAGPNEIEAMLAKEVDLGYIGPFPAMNGSQKSGGEIKIISGSIDGGAVLVVSKDSLIESVADLEGKKVAIPQFGNNQDLTLRGLLKKEGLKAVTQGGNVNIVQVENPDILALFQKKELDAALVPEPWGSRLEQEAGAKVLLDWDKIWHNGDYPTTIVIVRKIFLKEHPDIVKKWLAAHLELTEKIKANPIGYKDQLNSQLEKLTGKKLPDSVIVKALQRIKPTTKINQKGVDDLIQVSIENGYWTRKPDLNKIFDFQMLKGLESGIK